MDQANTSKLIERLITIQDPSALRDAFDLARSLNDHSFTKQIRAALPPLIRDPAAASRSVSLYNDTLIYDAPVSFDCFMLALERNRPPQEQFWLPRRRKLMPICQALQDMEDGKLDELFLSQPARTGKALADDTPVLTRHGWKRHGDLRVGDEVIGLDGQFKKVTVVHPKCQLDILVEFTNGEAIQCHEQHEWMFYDRGKQKRVIVEAQECEKLRLDSNAENSRKHRYRYQLPKHSYVVGEHKELPLDPYTLGVWLGDGTNKNPTITNAYHDMAIIKRVVSNGSVLRWKTQHKTTGVMYYGFDIRKALQGMGMCHSRRTTEKHIPEEYFTASVDQRLNLLAGLLDTDGTFRVKENRYVFTTTEERLRDDFTRLVSTFGWRASVVSYAPQMSSSRVEGKRTTYAVGFNPDCEIPCALERKQNHVFSKYRATALKRISRVRPKQGNCITVEGDGMYLVGKTLIPTHNSTSVQMFLLWVMARDSERSNLYCSYTDSVVNVLYNGILEVRNDPVTYAFADIFPDSTLASTNAKDLLINFDRKKRYASFTGRSLYGTLNGACDCNGYLVADDLISGVEEAMSKDRLRNAWAKVDNNMLPRAKENAKILWIGTRWSLTDPQGIRIDLLQNEPQYASRRWRVLNTPALDEKTDESNFDYAYGVGFSTEYYRQRRASFERNNDMASWFAQCQGVPIEREGAVFEPDGLRYYNGVLPDGDPDRVFMAIDPAYGGLDFTAGPVCIQYGEDIYIPDLIYDNSEKNITQPKIVQLVEKYGVKAMKVEGNKMTAAYGETIDQMLKEKGIRVNMVINTSHFTGTGKEQRIFDKASDIREHMIFLSEGHRTKEYSMAMQNLFSFTINNRSRNKHDDAPDSLAMAIDFAFFGAAAKVEVFSRPW